jgi:uncharacterized caspase-like protein
MKIFLLLLLTSSLLFITSCELFTDEPTKGDVYYINVGIDYKNNGTYSLDPEDAEDDDLKGTVNDAKELHTALGAVITKAKRTGFPYPMIQEGTLPATPLVPMYPSKYNVQQKLIALKSETKANDLTIFTYSGHGEFTTGNLILATTTIGSPPVASDQMGVRELLDLMAAIPGKKLIILDSCFSGMFVEKSPSSTNTVLNNSIVKFFETYHSSDTYGKPDLFVLTASAHTDSYEPKDAPHPHGFFTYALLEALGWNHPHSSDLSTVTPQDPPATKNGQITVDGLFKYVKANQAIPSRLKLFSNWSAFQHPMTTGGPLDLVLFNF